MGSPKQLLDFRGTPMLRHTAEVALATGSHPVIVVLGARDQELRPVLQGLGVEIVVNDGWGQGMGTSIQAGLQTIGTRNVCGAILTLADQPFVTTAFLQGLVTRQFESGKGIVASRYAGTAGVPAFFARSTFPWLMALGAGQGCKGVILGHPDDTLLVDCPEAAIDIDTPDDYRRVAGR